MPDKLILVRFFYFVTSCLAEYDVFLFFSHNFTENAKYIEPFTRSSGIRIKGNQKSIYQIFSSIDCEK